MKTPSPQEAAKMDWAEKKSLELWKEWTVDAMKTALLEADKNGYERGRKEIIEDISDVIGEHQEEGDLEIMRAVVQYLDKATLALRKDHGK